MKKLLTLVLALVMCASLCVPALATAPQTWDEAKLHASLTTDMSDYDAAWVEQDHTLYGNLDTPMNEDGSITLSGYRILSSDSKITVANTGVRDDCWVTLFCSRYRKNSAGLWVKVEEDGNRPFSLRNSGRFVLREESDDPMDGGSSDTWIMQLTKGKSYTFTASVLAGSGNSTDSDTLYMVEMLQQYSGESSYWYSRYLYQIDDTKAAAIRAAGKTPAEAGNPFTDVPTDAYYHDAVLWALEKKVTTGATATTFAPTATCTRGQVVTFLWRAMGEPAPTTKKNPFTDVKETEYYYNAILWAVEQGITTGTSATTFAPEDTCTSAHVVTFLWRASGKPAAENDGASWYSEAVAWANGLKLLDGTGKAFAPENLSPRADIVTYLYRVLNK